MTLRIDYQSRDFPASYTFRSGILRLPGMSFFGR
jgi:hypothetical protein